MATQPNIVLCICDQLRAFDVGCYGNPQVRTPHMDRMADTGARFETAVCNTPVCMASRSVLISGQHNRSCTNGVTNVHAVLPFGGAYMPQYPQHGRPHLPDPTLPELLRQAGYHTALIGKWHIHSWPHEVGFDTYLIPRVHHCHTGQHYTRDGGPEFVPDGYSVEFEADEVKRYIHERAHRSQPFFLYYSVSPPHCPVRDAPERYLSLYDPDEVALRPNVPQSMPDSWPEAARIYRWDYRYYGLRLPYTLDLPDDYSLRRLIADYRGLTTWVDEMLGRLHQTLRDAGMNRDTIVVFTSDHGDYLGSQGRFQKHGTGEEAVRIPLLFSGPSIARAAQTQQVASTVDIAPTLLELAGAPPAEHFHGVSLAPVLRGERSTVGENLAVIDTFGPDCLAVRTPTRLYTLPYEPERKLGSRPVEWFDLGADPYQTNNRAAEAQEPMLEHWLRDWDRRIPWMTPQPGT